MKTKWLSQPLHVVREVGGLGDMVRILPVLDGIRRKCPHRPIFFHGPAKYHDLFMGFVCSPPSSQSGGCWGMDRPCCKYIATDGKPVRTHRGAQINRAYLDHHKEIVLDLNCPAWRHEQKTRGLVTAERTHLFCQHAKVPTTKPEFHTFHGSEIRFLQPCINIALHPRSAGKLRQWPKYHWRTLARMLLDAGINPVWIDTSSAYCFYLPGHKRFSATVPKLIENLFMCRIVIAVDSGIFHLAGAINLPALGLFGPTNGKIISSIYPTAAYIQAPNHNTCKGMCYARNERGFNGGDCVNGCTNLALVQPKTVFQRALKLIGRK